MKTIYFGFFALAVLLSGCKDDDDKLFDKTVEERSAEAIAELKNNLVTAENGWRVKYQPEDGSGSFWVLMNFFDDNRLVIQSDLGAREGEFFMDTLTYRIDSSLGLELIFETYSFFSYLFETDAATFLAEYEFNFANKTPDGSLVFVSKTDPSDPTTLVFEQASSADGTLLAKELSSNINIIADDITGLYFAAPSYQLTYQNKDLAFFVNMDAVRRTLGFSSAIKKSTSASQPMNFSTGYYLQGDSLILHEPLSGTYHGVNVSMSGILLSKLSDATLDVCGGIPIHQYEGVTSQNDFIALKATLESPAGATFANEFSFYVSPLQYIFHNDVSAAGDIAANLPGAGSMQLYLSNDFNALGFYLVNADGTTTWALREFTPTIAGNRIIFNFEPTITAFGNPNPTADINNVYPYLDAFAQDGQTYMFKVEDGVYEMSNPCTGWSAAFVGIE